MEESAQLSEYIIQGYQYLGLTVSNNGAIFAITAVTLLLCLAWLSFRLVRVLLTGRLTRLIFNLSLIHI